MLEAVKMRLTSKAKNGTVFTFEGKNIPDYLVIFLKSAFPNVEEVKESNDEKSIEISKSDWNKEIEAQTTPAESLKLLRTSFGYTQQALADKAGITKQQISAMERGKEPIGRKMAHRLADALGTSYRNLFW
jgi:DNA-binding XRE family transcriptional regulator